MVELRDLRWKRRWHHRPRLFRFGEGEHRRVTWFEAFYDLIYAAAFIDLAHHVGEDPSLRSGVLFLVTSIPLWWAWNSYAFYKNHFVVDDVFHRAAAVMQVAGLAAITVTGIQVLRGNEQYFAAAVIAVRALFLITLIRTWVQCPDARELVKALARICVLGIALWAISIPMDHTLTYVFWGAAIAVDLFLPLSRAVRKFLLEFPPDPALRGDRFGLFIILVLGQGLSDVLAADEATGLRAAPIFMSILSLTTVCCIWWLYFDDPRRGAPKRGMKPLLVWIFAHFPLTVALVLLGVGFRLWIGRRLQLPLPLGEMWLVCGALCVVLVSLAVISAIDQQRLKYSRDKVRTVVLCVGAFLAVVLAVLGTELEAWVVHTAIAAVLVVLVVLDMWVTPLAQEEPVVLLSGMDFTPAKSRRVNFPTDTDWDLVRRDSRDEPES